MTSSDRRRVSAWLIVAALGVTTDAYAEGPEDERRAIQLFEEARKLAKDGRCAEAIPLFQESVKRAPGVGALLNLGLCYQTAGKTATAHAWFKKAAELATSRNDPRREEARSRARSIEASLSTLTVVVPRASRSADLVVRVDDAVLPREQWDVATPIDPGSHVVDVRSSALPKQVETVVVKPNGDRAQFVVPAPPPPSATGSSASTAAGGAGREVTHEDGDAGRGSTQRTLGLVTGGFGLGALVVGGVTGILAVNANGDLRDRCPAYPDCGNVSDRAERDDLTRLNDRQGALGTASTISFIAAGVLLVTGAVLVFTAR